MPYWYHSLHMFNDNDMIKNVWFSTYQDNLIFSFDTSTAKFVAAVSLFLTKNFLYSSLYQGNGKKIPVQPQEENFR